MPRPIGRIEPFTNEQIAKRKCRRCSEPASEQWDCCTNQNRNVPICTSCSFDLVELTLEVIGVESVEEIPNGPACARCSWSEAVYQWGISGRPEISLCADCDLELNRIVLQFFRIPDAARLIDSYAETLKGLRACNSEPPEV